MTETHHHKEKSWIPTTAVFERRYMRLLLGILMSATVLWWLIVLWSTKNLGDHRLFRTYGRANSIPGHDQSSGNSSTGSSVFGDQQIFSSLNRSDDSKLNLKTKVRETTLMELPSGSTKSRRLKCLGWRATGECSSDGARNPFGDLNCSSLIPKQASGYCEVEDLDSHETFRVMKRTCAQTKPGAILRCADAPGFANFRAEAQLLTEEADNNNFSLPNVRNNTPPAQKGIVMVVYPKLVASAYATIRVLRDIVNCQLPIEIWFSPDEMHEVPGSLQPLQNLSQNTSAPDITFRQILTHGKRIRFNAKIYAIYNSGFEQVLFLDADNVPVKDPSFLFETPEFEKMGAIFWPDYWHPKNTMFYIDPDSLVWQLLDMPFVDMFEQESGQLVIDRRRHAAPLALVLFYAFHQPNYFNLQRLAWGDKDLFRFAWLKLEKPFFMIQSPPAVAGKTIGGSFCGLTMVQHDISGEVLFLHRNQRKLMGELHPEIISAMETNLPVSEFESPPSDGYPDPELWTHLMTFRNTSARSDYIVLGEQGPTNFPDWQRCYGPRSSDSKFSTQAFADLSFSRLEFRLREFAFEATQIQRSEQQD